MLGRRTTGTMLLGRVQGLAGRRSGRPARRVAGPGAAALLGLMMGLAGAALVLLGDSERGRRGRQAVRDGVSRLVRRTGEAVARRGGAMGRARGLVLEIGSRLGGEVTDEVVSRRVRRRLRDAAFDVDVAVRDGQVTLTGSVPTDQIDRLVAEVAGVSGVRGVVSRLVGRSPEPEARSS